ncbi:CapA family protein [Alkaliphilus peptidifermentans]|uniref:Poly-gamma-glutamate synthesis protein (Capsule biosynthesis protein) n=1 Tax=Alkaliphilus peptidifermentans DSM 18978 TaxID=1120976 RepID=A0A1G5HL91_9FIRM|nr:CapA family protein [Alkaliphilus peptidifermentans]SCY64526.1 poly-gamma-glutamate synthesis protein (capsule biosynthesis protein) [Alkaliphilus peptidifermentans DSM 18978]
MRRLILFIMVLCLSLTFISCQLKHENTALPIETMLEENPEKNGIEIPVVKPQFVDISISAVGDIMVHSPQLTAQYFGDEYNFDNNFKYIKPYLQSTDLMLGNLETTFGGSDRGYSGYPLFNSPDALATALKEAGFHALATANNHSFDTGRAGILRTIEVLRQENLMPFGTRLNEEEESFIIMEVKGINVGLTSFTYETPRLGNYKAINSIRIPTDTEALIDSFSYEFLEDDLLVMKDRVDKMKDKGAEVLIFCLHWGNEYHQKPSSYQKRIAQELADYGVNIIFGSHPHVLQPIEIISSTDNMNQTLVAYSLGNFISNQRYEYLNNRYTEDGMIVNVTLRKDLINDNIEFSEITFVPTWVHKYRKEGRSVYEIIPLYDALENKEEYNLISSDSIWRAENSKNNTIGLIENKSIGVVSKLSMSMQGRYDYWYQYKLD